MRFIVDAQLPPALAQFLLDNGHEAAHVADLGLAAASDRRIWQIATERGAVIVTKDEDFSRLRSLRATGPAIVWIRIGNTTRGVLLLSFAAAFADVLIALERGDPVVVVRKE